MYQGHHQTDDERITSEIEYLLIYFPQEYVKYTDVDDLSRTRIPIQSLMTHRSFLKDYLTTPMLADKLEDMNYELSNDRLFVIIDMEPPWSSDEEDSYADRASPPVDALYTAAEPECWEDDMSTDVSAYQSKTLL